MAKEKKFEITVKLPKSVIDKIFDLEADQSELLQEEVGVDNIFRYIVEEYFGAEYPEVIRTKIENRRNAIIDMRNSITILETTVESLQEKLDQERLNYKNAVATANDRIKDLVCRKDAEIKDMQYHIDYLKWKIGFFESLSLWERIKNLQPEILAYEKGVER